MNPEYTFMNIRQRHDFDPNIFPIPSEPLKRSVRLGDIVALQIAKKPKQQADDPVSVETLRVCVDGINWPMFDAVALAPLDLQKYHGINTGDSCCFEEHHIMDVLNGSDPYAKQKSVAIAQFAGVSREFLEEVTSADLSINRTTLSELDEFTIVLINRKGDVLEAMIAVDVDTDERDMVASGGSQPYSTSFSEAANRLRITNLPPDVSNPNPVKRRNQLIVRFSMPSSGRALVEVIYAKIETVHQEVKTLSTHSREQETR